MNLLSHTTNMSDGGISCFLDADVSIYSASAHAVYLNGGRLVPTSESSAYLLSKHPCMCGVWVTEQPDGTVHIKVMEA